MPSETEIVMPEEVPAAVGVPLNLPVVVLKLAHEGRPTILNVSVPPLGFVVVGVKLYA